MKATVELQLIPVGSGVSVRDEIKKVIAMLDSFNFVTETHASGTNIEGELCEILDAVEKLHQYMHDEGVVRILSYLKLETRTDKQPTLAGKRL